MKHLVIFLLLGYKKLVSPIFDMVFGLGKGCRFDETCSEYAIRVISSHGIVRGGFLSIVRILRCQPFSKAYLKYESI